MGLGARVQHWLNSVEGLGEQLTCEGIEFTRGGLILIPRRQLCALLLRSLLPEYGNQVSNPNSQLSVNFNASVVNVDLTRREVMIERETGSETVAYELLVGADGIHSTIRSAMMIAQPDEINYYQQKQRPHVWKVLQLPISELQQPPRIIRLQTRRSNFGLVFGACLPQKDDHFSALIFGQPVDSSDHINRCGIITVEELQQLFQLGQGCTAAIADAVALSSLLQQHPEKWSSVLPQFSMQQVKEGHAASDLSLIALIFYHSWLGLLYRVATFLWVIILRQPSILAQVNQVNANYVQVLRKNRLWIWLAKNLR